MQLVIHLDDYTDRGQEWNFWEQATILDFDDFEGDNLSEDLQWTNFEGKFGNQEKLGCEIEPIVGFCGVGKCGRQPLDKNPSSEFDTPSVCPATF